MTAVLRLAICAVVIALGFGGGALVGRIAGPLPPPGRPPALAQLAGPTPGTARSARAPGGHHSLEMSTPAGLLMAQDGYSLDVPRTILAGVEGEALPFRIVDPGGEAVRRFELRHERDLHFVLVARDLTTYHHIHPTLAPDGTWTATLPLLAPGSYHAYASFAPVDGPDLTLSVSLLVPGNAVFAPLPATGTTVAVDGYEVSLDGQPAGGAESTVTLRVAKDGAPVGDLDPYLGARGHLVALRAGDMAYSHVHPIDESDQPDGPEVHFMVHLPSRGDYRLFFDFAHADVVHTAAFTVTVP